jgi:hypothetical protein
LSLTKAIFKSIFLSCALGVMCSATWADAIQDLDIQVAGHTWTYHLHVPRQASSVAAPLVVVLHGAGGNGRDYLTKNGWVALSDKEGFVVVAPDGLPALPRLPANFRLNPRLWNSGQLMLDRHAQKSTTWLLSKPCLMMLPFAHPSINWFTPLGIQTVLE